MEQHLNVIGIMGFDDGKLCWQLCEDLMEWERCEVLSFEANRKKAAADTTGLPPWPRHNQCRLLYD